VQQLFREVEAYCSVRVLSVGVTTAYAVQATGEFEILQELEALLKEHYKFSVVYAGFNSVIHRIVEDLSVDTGSELFPIPVCGSCGAADPFPTQVTLRDAYGKARGRAVVCERCVSGVEGEQEAEDLCRLVDASAPNLQVNESTEIVRKRSLFHYARLRKPARGESAREVRAGVEDAAERMPLVRLAS